MDSWSSAAASAVFVTVRVFLVGVDDESTVVVVVEDAVVVVVMVAVISEAVVIRVQLGAVGDVWTVVSAVLVTVTVPAGRRQVSDSVCVTLCVSAGLFRLLYLSIYNPQLYPTIHR